MAIHIHFINVIIPKKKIEEKLSILDFNIFLEKQKSSGKHIIYDDYLYCESAMDQYEIQNILNYWKEQGFEPFIQRDGKQCWKDFCVVDMFMGPTLPCDWIEFETKKLSNNDVDFLPHVFMKGKPKGKLVSLYESVCNKEI